MAYNLSNDVVVALVNDGQEWEIPANGSTRFTVQVPVPKNPVQTGSYGILTGPSTLDKVIQVSVAFRNVRTGRLTTPIFCSAGAKVVTNIWYEVNFGQAGARCTAS